MRSLKKIYRSAITRLVHKEASLKAGQDGNYDEAITKLKQAIKFTPAWAYPPADPGFHLYA